MSVGFSFVNEISVTLLVPAADDYVQEHNIFPPWLKYNIYEIP